MQEASTAMPRKYKGPPTVRPPLATYLQSEADAKNLSLRDIEAATGISDSALSRIFSGEVTDPKASQLAKIANAIGIPVWRVMAHAGYTDEGPADATEEMQKIAVIVDDQPELQSILRKLIGLSPRDLRAVRKYIELLRSGDD